MKANDEDCGIHKTNGIFLRNGACFDGGMGDLSAFLGWKNNPDHCSYKHDGVFNPDVPGLLRRCNRQLVFLPF